MKKKKIRIILLVVIIFLVLLGLSVFKATRDLVRMSSTPTKDEYKKYDYILENYKNYAREQHKK